MREFGCAARPSFVESDPIVLALSWSVDHWGMTKLEETLSLRGAMHGSLLFDLPRGLWHFRQTWSPGKTTARQLGQNGELIFDLPRGLWHFRQTWSSGKTTARQLGQNGEFILILLYQTHQLKEGEYIDQNRRGICRCQLESKARI